MKLSRTLLFHRSRDTRLLLRIASGIGLVGLLAGFAVSVLSSGTGRVPFFDRSRGLPPAGASWEWLDPGTATVPQWAEAIRELGAAEPAAGDAPRSRPSAIPPAAPAPETEREEAVSRLETDLLNSPLPVADRDLLLAFLRGLHGEESRERPAAIDALRAAAAAAPPRRWAGEFLGEVLEASGATGAAIDAYLGEVDRFPRDSGRSLHRLLLLLASEGRHDEIDALMARPGLRDAIPVGDRIDRAIHRRDYLGLLGLTFRHDLAIADPWLASLSLFAAAIWFLIVTPFAGRDRERWSRYLAALVLGWISASATLYAVFLQEEIRGFTLESAEGVVGRVLYFVAGVALREESLKLLCFLPLVPWIARRGREIDALVTAGLVGLGFALNENIGYVDRGAEFTAWSRFLTANFAHIAWTGVAGLALYRCWLRPRRQWDNLLADFLIVVAAHGAYDALIAVPELSDYGFLSLVVYALSAYLFLDQAGQRLSPGGSMTVSPLAVFVVGSSLLIAVTFVFACWAVPFRAAAAEYVRSLAEVVPVGFIFINRLRSH